ncbi:MAG: DUF4384 domain-containing protein [Saprospiraceae bacterium]|nr:DUF4384 domain-containing protein [Saprospiraceae bacterium]
MPVRMEKDPQESRGNQNSKGGNNNFLLRLLPLLFMFLLKRPKLILPILVVGGIWYFFFGGQDMLAGALGGPTAINTEQEEGYSFGAALSEDEYDKAQVFEPLSYGFGQNSLPSRVSLDKYIPQRLHQGRQGSCVGWASAYAGRTILEARASGRDPNTVAFSPSYLYNQIHLDNCQGAYMRNAMETMKKNGALPFSAFRYDDRTCSNYPSGSDIQQGRQFTIKGFNRLSKSGSNYKTDLTAIKQHIAQGAPVVIGMMVGGTFMQDMIGKKVWKPTQRDYSQRGYSGHAMCVIGYNDAFNGGSFQVMNSWGEDWGEDGIFWVSYRDFDHFTREAYGLYPMGSSEKYDDNKLGVQFGLFDTSTKNQIALKKAGDISFQTVKPIRKGDKFKILVENSIECYIYVFGQETDGSSYVLFPYTEKHSPYCGITGTRLFPKDYSMKLDDIGKKDYIAVVVSKKELNYDQLNKAISSSRASGYAEKLKQALGNERITSLDFKTGSTVAFEAETNGKNVVGMVIEIDKQ